ncbi:unnamed protein product [Penicillium salamii]|uniref:NB-ARC domain-containing protein n=1 Tax=Penicillium salamii TaxID=1612424 RepID=A0A9W4NPB5_9EURO|nr:unnamed protein product [Penicillium salamii]CAG8136249.1 unnamed protein product [Penicillium salamii]CAG8171334.1 unnamed protein product [Penicillium salamii]CAG8178583.1 unnamed protein product [Penicillium salamii]CAG8189992.1 unnamed protein product [Penicillium salamii]
MSTIEFRDNFMGTQVGINSGNVNVHHHPGTSSTRRASKAELTVSPAPPETPPEPCSTVPFGRDPDFVPRGSILEDIEDRCSSSTTLIALVGLGGVGKSQLAIEYSYRFFEKSADTWAFWIHANNADRLELSYWDIANRLKIPGRKDSQASVFQLVTDWLHEAKRGKWVLILDNLDDEGLLREPLQAHSKNTALRKPFQEFLPRCPHGTIILTTRNRQVARMVANERDIFPVEPMDELSAVALVKKKLPTEPAEDDIKKLVETLEFMPLAIVQAVSYIRNQGQFFTVPRYLKIFRKDHRVLDDEAGNPQRDGYASKSTLVTWRISFDYILQIRPSAADLLSLMSFFDRQGIPRTLLQENSRSNSDTTEQSDSDTESSESGPDDDLDFNKDILVLRDFSFISINQNPETLEMHGLVQLALRNWLEIQGKTEELNAKFIIILYSALPEVRISGLGKWRQLFPHVKSAMSQRPSSREALLNWATLLQDAAEYAQEDGKHADVKRLASKSKSERETLLGPDNIHTLWSSRTLCRAYYYEGRWQEAEALQTQLVKKVQRVLEDDDKLIIRVMHDLGLTYICQERWQDAEKLQLQVVEKSKQLLGEESHDTIANIGNLTMTYIHHGKLQLAVELLLELLPRCKRVLGEEHPTTSGFKYTLATAYMEQGRFHDAESLLTQALEAYKNLFGNKHPVFSIIMGSLASIYQEHQRWGEAEELYLQVLAIQRQVFGGEHPVTLGTLNGLAMMYQTLGRYSESEVLHLQVIEIQKRQKRVFGEQHHHTLVSQNNLALAYRGRGLLKDAEELQIPILEKGRELLGEEHPLTMKFLNNLAKTYQLQGRWQDMFNVREKGSTIHMPSLTRIPIPHDSGDQRPDKIYHPTQPRDIFEAFSILRQCGQGRLPRFIILQILELARYWILHKAWRKGTLCVTEDDCRERAPYLATELVPDFKYPVQEIVCRIVCHEQDLSSDPESSDPESSDHENHGTPKSSFTWFELDMERPSDQGHGGHPRHQFPLRNRHACSQVACFTVYFTQSTYWVRNLQVGDRISIIPMARYPGWMNLVKQASIEVYTTCLSASGG